MASELDKNRKLARDAVDHVLRPAEGKGMKAGNWSYYNSKTQAESYEACQRPFQAKGQNANACLKRQFSAVEECVYIDRPRQQKSARTELNIRAGRKADQVGREDWMKNAGQYSTEIMAATARHRGCGNCGLMAALAFEFITKELEKAVRNTSVHMIGYNLGASKYGGDDDHTIVVVGAPQAHEKMLNPEAWGPVAVVCDPWSEGFTEKESFGAYRPRFLKDRLQVIFPKPALKKPSLKDRWPRGK